MTGCQLIEGSLRIPAERAADALTAALKALGAASAQGIDTLIDRVLGIRPVPGAETNAAPGFVIDSFHGTIDDRVEAALQALAPYAQHDAVLLFQDSHGQRWRYLISGGTAVKQNPVVLWRDVDDDQPRTGGILAPLTLSRCADRYAQWWAEAAADDEIIHAIEAVLEATKTHCEAEYALHEMMLTVFQNTGSSWRSWMQVEGLGPDVTIEHLTLDMDIAHNGDGVIDGVDVVMFLYVGGSCAPRLTQAVKVYVDHAGYVFAPTANTPVDAFAEIIDTTLQLINQDIAEQDQFTLTARDTLTRCIPEGAAVP